MSTLITIKNENLTVVISTLGAEMQSVKKNNEEYLWYGDPKAWSGRAPVMFPICGGLKDDKYTLNGKEYTLAKHGYAKNSEFEIEEKTESKAVFLLKSTDETKKIYPFDYELRLCYELIGDSIKVDYKVTNKTNSDMYFSVGAHEAYLCPEGIEEYYLSFEKEENLECNVLHGNLLADETYKVSEPSHDLALKYDFFKIDALTFLNLKSRSVTLNKKDGSRKIRVDFDGFDYMFVWTTARMNADYICIEPWAGIPDFEGTSYEISEKIGINKIESGKTMTKTHTITIEK